VTNPPLDDRDIPAYWQRLGLPGLADIHVHFLPPNVLKKVWAFFDAAGERRDWPIQYRYDEPTRLEYVRSFGLRGIPSLTYPHKPQMAQWLNGWCSEFAERVPDAVHSATLYPEDGVGEYVAEALEDGARLFKVHVQVGVFSPADPLLDPAWGVLEDAGVPIVIHAGSAPTPGEFTGPDAVGDVLRRFPKITFVIAHLGMSEYDAFADLAFRYENVHLDTTMANTDFTNQKTPFGPDYVAKLADLGDKVVLGSDFPNIPYQYAHQIEALDRLDLGDDWMRSVLWHNGARLMGLSAD